jgi:Fe-S-cluster containining protein
MSTTDASDTAASDSAICQACGACCGHSAEWPRFSLETEEQIARIPEAYVTLSGMRCEDNRCSALKGEIGSHVACLIYEVRPDVCRACVIGDDACAMAREARGMPAIAG